MISSDLILLWIELGIGFLASVFALFVWARARELPWLFVAGSFVIRFFGKIYNSLSVLGVMDPELADFYGIPLDRIVFVLMPDTFILIAFILFLVTLSRL